MEHQSCNWDLVIKMKYGNVLKRFSTFVKERKLDYNMDRLILKIKETFNLDRDAELALTYEDNDGDIITLEQDEDLIDATIKQKLNPLRIEVQLSTPGAELMHHFKSLLMSSYSTSPNSPLMQELDTERRINSGRIGDEYQSYHNNHCGCHSSPHVCGLRPKKLKLKSRFIQDVTIPDGTRVATSTAFTKIWRMYNNGKDPWPYGTQFVRIGGDHMGSSPTVQLQIPPPGFPVQENIDVQVDFIAPQKPGRYISYWRLESPSGEKFGHCFWVLIKVSPPSPAIGCTSFSLDLNLPLEDMSAGTGLLKSNAPTDQPMHHVAKPLLDLNEDSQNVDSTLNLGHDKEEVFEWDQLLVELQDMGFSDKELNRRLLVEYGGSIKRVVLSLIARENMV